MRKSLLLGVAALVLAGALPAFAGAVDFGCAGTVPPIPCTGTVTQSGSNYSSTNIGVYNTTGQYSLGTAFTLAFNTAASTISITSGSEILTGTILGYNAQSVGFGSSQQVNLTLNVLWTTLPSAVTAALGTPQGLSLGSVISVSVDPNTFAARSVDILITPTPEPASLALLGTGLLTVGGLVRRRLKQHSR